MTAPRADPAAAPAARGREGDTVKQIELQYHTARNMGSMWWGKKLLDEHRGTLIACSDYFKVAQRDWQETKWGYFIVYDLKINRNYAA